MIIFGRSILLRYNLPMIDLLFPTTTTALSVTALTNRLQTSLQAPQFQQVWVMGEVSSASLAKSGLYFTLQDPDGQAAINCVIWQRQLPRLALQPQTGERVYLLGSISLYAPQGKYQLQVQQVLPAGAGLQALRLQQLRQRLAQAGYFDRQLSLPTYPGTIAVVTSPQAAAWGDIRRTIALRYPGINLLLSPATVQGDSAPTSIAKAIERVVHDRRAEVLILARGGGASEDLSCFNSELVVQAIADCPIPVVSGIGHERDESLADLAADWVAATPTAAVTLVVPSLLEMRAAQQRRIDRLQVAMVRMARQEQYRLHQLQERYERVRPDRLVAQERVRVARLKQRLRQAIATRLGGAKQLQGHLQERLQALDPNLVLQRGYAVVRDRQGQILRDAATLKAGQELDIQLARGSILVKIVEQKHEKEPRG
jgi:exodeoxyribonuclease VII large subunit